MPAARIEITLATRLSLHGPCRASCLRPAAGRRDSQPTQSHKHAVDVLLCVYPATLNRWDSFPTQLGRLPGMLSLGILLQPKTSNIEPPWVQAPHVSKGLQGLASRPNTRCPHFQASSDGKIRSPNGQGHYVQMNVLPKHACRRIF